MSEPHVSVENATLLFGGSVMSPVPNPYPVYARLRRERPIVALSGWMDTSYLVSRYDDVAAGLKNGELFSPRGNARGIGLVMGRTILEMEGQEHLRHRRIVTPSFSLRALRGEVEREVERTTHHLIDKFERDREADLVGQFTMTFPLRVMAGIMGIPISDFEEFHQWALDLISVADDPGKGFAAAEAIVGYLRPILEERRNAPTTDLLSTLVHAEVEGERLSEEEVLSFLRLLLPAGAETTFRLTGSVLYALLTHREQLEEVLADRSLLDDAIDETLRWESPVQFTSRELTRDFEIDGHVAPKGELAILSVGSANRDERRFEDPDRFDIHRANKSDHVAFGFGEHFCLGSHLARVEARIAVSAMLDRLSALRLDPDVDCRIVGLAFRSPDRLPVRFG
ncbi:MAG: cytochrome P450 [Deltaproteobacteria bacterium]|nr:cytochrome P450 [Deltaproteobacteria bacterium]